MKKLAALAVVALLSTTGVAHANEFSGPRAEVHTGFSALQASGKATLTSTYDGETEIETQKARATHTSAVIGAGVGYDHAVSDKVIVGVEANFNFSNDTFPYGFGSESDDIEVEKIKAKHEFDVMARVGYTVSPSTLLYVKAGYANLRLKTVGLDYSDIDDDPVRYSKSNSRGGWRVGAGIETLLGQNIYAKLEYNYTDFKDIKWSHISEGPGYKYEERGRIGLSRHQALAGIGIRF